ncbi:amino-acid N-acetyltransferase [Parvibium lacunae]|uniref:Amino-acid acetyltransferase n=1 Tax=Parvibium lacunae TaxID=1888893 RepID=A0A368L857_9BURK|nr:amino-acid N-acetyltransferase [Parvibium lacunae]RCS59860.1 amino-acid N-acetyltransferase [Parvibium lacunae]
MPSSHLFPVLPVEPNQFVAVLRRVAPYVHAYYEKTFVIGFCGEAVQAGKLNALVQDVALLHAMGVRVVVVHGSRPQVEEQIQLRKSASRFHNGIRITDTVALECVKEAAGEVRLDIEAAFSQGLPNTPMAHAEIRVLSGNFITARPVGIVDGVDYQHTGIVRKIAANSITHALDTNAIVLLSPLGFSPTGEAFNLSMEDVATAVASALKADKLLFVTDADGVRDAQGKLHLELSLEQAQAALRQGTLAADTAYTLQHAIEACKAGVNRSHILPYTLDGSILLETFTHDGVGTMVTHTLLESLREATADDVGGIVSLIEPLEADGTLVPRGRSAIERDIEHFSVIEHDGVLFGCAALYPYPQQKIGEMACLTVHGSSQGMGDGERLLKRIEQRARAQGLEKIFVLTTRTMHWFLKRGFVQADVSALPAERQRTYNPQRKSLVLVKTL